MISGFRRRPLVYFFLFAYGITWAVIFSVRFFPADVPAVLYRNLLPNLHADRDPTSALQLLAMWGPSLAAVLVSSVAFGRSGAREWLSRWTRWRIGWRWYVVALLFPPLLDLVRTLIEQPTLFAPYARQPLTTVITNQLGQYVLTLVPLFLWIVGGEEGGWRGFALPRLQQRYGPLVGTVVLGLLWAAWHLPSIIRPGHTYFDMGGVAFAVFLCKFALMDVCYAAICTWIFNHTRGSILPVMLWHASANASVGVVSDLFQGGYSAPGSSVGDWLLWPILMAILIGFTRGRLGYDRYREQENTALSTR